jgi:hypothetical protein
MRPIAAAASAVRTYALLVGGAALLIVAAFIQDAGPDRGSEWLGVVVLAGLLAVPPVLLYVFSTALRALADLPQRVRGAPGDLRTHRDEAQRVFGRRGPGSVVLPFRLLRLSVGARETLTPYAPVLPLVSVPYLMGTGLAAVAGLAELLLGIVALIALAG